MEYLIKKDTDGHVTRWVCRGLNDCEKWLNDHMTYGFYVDAKLVGGLIFHDCRPYHDIWWTVFSTDKRWCNRRMLRKMFGLVFEQMKCRKINLLVDTDNAASVHFVEKLGFKKEGIWRCCRENGKNCYLYGMLKDECQWI